MSSESTSKQNRLCGLCEENPSKYCCPRCDVFYCSLNCYKSDKHLQCSESFYKECVDQELASHEVDDDAKNKMMEILKKMHENSDEVLEDEIIDEEDLDSDDGSDMDLHTRIKDLNLDDPNVLWNALTEDERNEFEAILSKGDVENIIPQWDPWWMYKKEKKLIEETNKESNIESEMLKMCPEIKVVPEFSSLTSVKPSHAIRYNIANVIASYAFIMRYFNGEIEPVEASNYILNICNNLDSNNNFDDPDLAVESVAQRCLQSEYIHTDEASLDVMKNDTFQILEGPSEENTIYYSKAAFSHLIQIFTDAKSMCKMKNDKKVDNKGDFSRKFPEYNKNHLPILDINKIKKVVKKLEYYLSFLVSCDTNVNNK